MKFEVNMVTVECSVIIPDRVECKTSAVIPVVAMRDRGLIYRGFVTTESVEEVDYEPDFEQNGDFYTMELGNQMPAQTRIILDGTEFVFDRYSAQYGGVTFYYSSDGTEIHVGMATLVPNPTATLSVPVSFGTPESVVVPEKSPLPDGESLMINGKAPYGSSEDDAVWTVFINPLDEYGNVVEEEIEVLENQIWSEIKNMYN